MVAKRKGDEVLPQVEVPWYRMSARTFLSRARIAQHVFRSETEIPYITKVKCPILAFYGSEEEWCGSADDLDSICDNATSAPRVDTKIIEGADHVYWGKATEAASLIGGWVDELTAA